MMQKHRKLKQTLSIAGHARWFRASVALVMLVSVAIPTLTVINDLQAYALTPEVEKVLGEANKNLSAKFSFDKENNKWRFNKDGAAAQANTIAEKQGQDAEGVAAALGQLRAQQVGGGGKEDTSLYSVDLAVNAKEGITYYDNQTNLSFKMIPDFTAREGKLIDGRIVYPFTNGGQIVYTAKSNGLKEDIVLSKYIGDKLSYGYTLQLPETLEARLLDDGSIGVYSADPSLFGNVSYGSDTDQAKVMDARKNGNKTHMVFGIPAPFIKDQSGRAGHTKYTLTGNQLTVHASELEDLKYPLAIDPSVSVTSSTDFSTGNNEGMIEFGTDQISRGSLTGGTLGTWDNAGNTTFSLERSQHETVAYNGYLYVAGGTRPATGTLNTILYAAIGSDGNVGAWQSAANTFTTTRSNFGLVAYNGYMYALGGYNNNASYLGDTQYATINSDGSLGVWQATNSFSGTRYGHVSTAYNGYMYVIGGCTGSVSGCNALTGTVEYASINANGTLGTWSSAGAASGQRVHGAGLAYNGYMYVMGGKTDKDFFNNLTTPTNVVQYAKINENGTLGSWSTTTSLAVAKSANAMTVYNGYVYDMGGEVSGGSGIDVNVRYAQIYANGTFGSWLTTSAYDSATGRFDQGIAAYKGYTYVTGGCVNNQLNCGSGGGVQNNTRKAKIDSPGSISTYTQSANTVNGGPLNGGTGLYGAVTVAYNGWLYVLGGRNNSNVYVNTVYRAQINADGSTGTWSTTVGENFSVGRGGAAAVAYNGYMYIMGGVSSDPATECPLDGGAYYCRDIQKAPINANGSLGTWVSAGGIYASAGKFFPGAAAYNGYMYVIGGIYNNNSTASTEIDIAPINADGTVGTWVNNLSGLGTEGRGAFGLAQDGNRVYLSGGRKTSSMTVNDDVIFATLGNGGAISAWQSAGPNFTNDRAENTSVVHNGYLYIMGGNGSGGLGNVALADTQYAKINTDGTIGAWVTSPTAFATSRTLHNSVAYNGYLYVIGGCNSPGLFGNCSAILNDVQYAPINNGGGGAPVNLTATNWGGTPPARFYHSTVAVNGYLYVIGGCTAYVSGPGCSQVANDYLYTQINQDGSLGAWTRVTNALNTGGVAGAGVWNMASVVSNGYVYLLGGCTLASCAGFDNTVQYASITGGALGTWTSAGTGGTFTGGMVGRMGAAAASYNGYVYLLGGHGSGGALNDVWVAQANSNGTLNTWQSAGNNFTSTRYLPSAIAHKGYLYVMGGFNSVGSATVHNSVQFIPIAANGTITGSWSSTTSFPQNAGAMNVSILNGYMYLHGGAVSTVAATSVTRYAPILSNGQLGSWALVPGYTFPRAGTGGAIQNGYTYVTGGWTGAALSNQVDYAMLQSQSRIGRYSKLTTVPATVEVAGVYFNGSVGSGSSVTYKVAPASGIFSTNGTAIQGTGIEPTPACGLGTIHYVMISATLDDSQNAIFGDSSQSNITDVQIYYRSGATPPPNLRLNGGKWFYADVQQALDICKQ